jgi:lysophospholipase L1-like esterase
VNVVPAKLLFNAATLVFLLTLLGVGTLEARQSGPTPYPDPKDNAAWPGKGPIRYFGWMEQDRKSFWSKRDADQGKTVFVGDSIIGGWKLDKDFPGKAVANRGIGGDVTRGLLFRFQEDVLDLHPKAIVLEIGSNDISSDSPVETIVSNYNALLGLAQRADPAMPILLLALLPRGIPTGAKAPSPALGAYLQKVNARIPLLNAELSKIPAARKNVTFLDCYSLFLRPDGTLDDALFNDDKVHPVDAGHSKLAGLISKTLTELAK